jgi:hypothetical protein
MILSSRTLRWIFWCNILKTIRRLAWWVRNCLTRMEPCKYLLTVSGDAPEDNKKFKDKFDLPYSLLSDPDHNVLTELGAYGEKKNYGKVYMGVIRSHWVIDEDGTVIDERRNVQALKSAPLALRALGIEVVEE